MSVRTNFITGSNPLYMYGSNKWYGDKSQGQVFAYNNGNNSDTATFSSGNGTGNPAGQGIFMGDSGDTITFTGGLWTAVGLTRDDKTGITGMEFKNDKGDDILVSGNVKLAGDFSGSSDTVAVGPGKASGSGSGDPYQGVTNPVDSADAALKPRATELTDGIKNIEAFAGNSSGKKDYKVTQDEIKKALDGGALGQPNTDGYRYWNGVLHEMGPNASAKLPQEISAVDLATAEKGNKAHFFGPPDGSWGDLGKPVAGSGSGSGSNSNPPTIVGDAKGSASKISHKGQWEAITGGNSSSTLTLAQAKAALDKPDVSTDSKTALKNVVDNWNAMGFKDEQQVTLQDMQNYGDGKIVLGGAATNAASYNGQSFGAEVELKGKRDDAFGLGSTTQDMIDRLNWAMDQGGATGNRMYMGTTSTSKADLEGAITGLEKVKTTQDANNPDQQAQDQRQIDYIRSLINS